jgi:AsmA protein
LVAETVGDTAEAVRTARVAKWTAIILGGIVLLLVATVFVLTSIVDPNRYRGKIEGIVADLAGRPFVIEGKLALTWYPWLGIRTGPAHLDNAPGVPGPPLLEWQSISVAAKVWPLLKGDVVADRIRLQSPVIHLRRDAQGHGNWEGLGSRTAAPADARAAPTDTTNASAVTASTRQLQIAGVEIRGGTVDYVDEVSGQHMTLTNLELDLGEWRAGHPLPVHTRFIAHTQSLPPGGVPVALDSLAVTVRTEPLTVAAPKLTLKVANAQLDGDVSYERTTNARAHGSLALQTPSLRELLNDLALNQSLPHDPTTLGPLELTTTWSYDGGAIEAKPLALKLDGVSFNGWLQKTAAPAGMWAFELHGDRIDLGRYAKIDSTHKKPFELPVDALRAINANGSLIFDQVVLADTHMANVRMSVQTPLPPTPVTGAAASQPPTAQPPTAKPPMAQPSKGQQ